MAEERAIAVDLAELTNEDGDPISILAWGDPVTVVEEDEKRSKVEILDFETKPDGSILPTTRTGFIRRHPRDKKSVEVSLPADQVKVLKLDFVDVQQGDGALLETPAGKTITLDGGDNQLFARYLASRFPGTGPDNRKAIDAMLVSHGDADHFAGLAEIRDSETNENPRKRLFAEPLRVFHNGLVKRPSKVDDVDSFGATEEVGGKTIITGLETDVTKVPDDQLNQHFERWKKALLGWEEDGAEIEFRRLAKGDDDAFDFLAGEGIEVEVLGPILTHEGGVTGLRFLGEPPKGPQFGAATPDAEFGSISPSHTINGHSILLRLGFKNWRLLFAGDLNTQSEQQLVADAEAGKVDLQGEVFKVPHHGSAEYSTAFLQAVKPLVSVVSSGDENARKEYIHPRATLMNALGRCSRNDAAVVFVTELVAFFETVGWVRPDEKAGVDSKPPKPEEKDFFAFRRTAYGQVRVRTDGERLFVYTNSGQKDLKEGYAFTADAPGEANPVEVVKA
ncbi:MAG TPA: MBL fold metallo-hydrolase [Solirubrobacterales bacterium]|nr:MBL fold metallo-hydrolase [Solirubrobacterales bacterium]